MRGVLRSTFVALLVFLTSGTNADPIVTEPFQLDAKVVPATLPSVGANVTLSWDNVDVSGGPPTYHVFSNGVLIASVETNGFETRVFGSATYFVLATVAGEPVGRSNVVMISSVCEQTISQACAGTLADAVWYTFFHCSPLHVGIVWVVPDLSCINPV